MKKYIVGWISLSITLLVMLSANIAGAGVQDTQSQVELAQDLTEESIILGEPCGNETLIEPDTLCLTGRVLAIDGNGNPIALHGILVEASLNGIVRQNRSANTQGAEDPIFGINLTPLEPGFLEEITLTAVIGDQRYDEQVTVYPDFDTQTQTHDILVGELTHLPIATASHQLFKDELQAPWQDVSKTAVLETIPEAGLYGSSALKVTYEAKGASIVKISEGVDLSDVDQLTFYARAEAGHLSPNRPELHVRLRAKDRTWIVKQTIDLSSDWEQYTIPMPSMPDGSRLWVLNISNRIGLEGMEIYMDEVRLSHSQGDSDSDQVSSFSNDGFLWGYVVDYLSQGPVAGAEVTATYGTPPRSVSVVTADHPHYSYPVYRFEAADLPGLSIGDTIQLFSEFDGDTAYQSATVVDDTDSIQKNMVTGWKCSDFDPLPGGFKIKGFPRRNFANKGFPSLPNAFCLWGIGSNNGVAADDISIEIEVDGHYFQGVTKQFPGENIPRYGIAVPDADQFLDRPIRITAVFNGLTTETTTTISANDAPVQQIDLDIIGVGIVDAVSMNHTNQHLWLDGYLWTATTGGVIRWNPANSNDQLHLTPQNSPLDQLDTVWIHKDDAGNLYFESYTGTIQRFNPSASTWQTLDTGLTQSIGQITPSQNQIWTFKKRDGFAQFDPATGNWEKHRYTDVDVIKSDTTVYATEIDAQGGAWFATKHGLLHYDPSDQSWERFKTSNSPLTQNALYDISEAPNGVMWIGTKDKGFFSYDPAALNTDAAWRWYKTSNSKLKDNRYPQLDVDSSGLVYITTRLGTQILDPASGIWSEFDTSAAGLSTFYYDSLAVDSNDELWSFNDAGLIHWRSETDYDHFLVTNSGPIGPKIYDVLEDHKGRSWFASSGGLSVYHAAQETWQGYSKVNGYLPQFEVLSVAVTPDDVLYAGLDGGIWHLDLAQEGAVGKFIKPDNSPLLGGEVRSMTWHAPCDCLLIGSRGGINLLDPTQEEWVSIPLSDPLPVIDTLIHSNGEIWGSTGSAGIFILQEQTNGDWIESRLTVSNGLPSDSVMGLAEDSQGDIWGTLASGGLIKIDGSGQITSFGSSTPNIPVDPIVDLVIDQYDRIWMATRSDTHMFDPLDQSGQHFETSPNLGRRGEIQQAISFGRSDDFWVGTDNGAAHWHMPIEQADIAVSLSGTDTMDVGQQVELVYTLDIANTGELAAQTELTLQLPVSTTIVSSDLPPFINGESVDLGILPAGARRTYTLAVRPGEGWQPGQTHVMQATASGGNREALTANNRQSQTTQVKRPDAVDLTLSLSGPATFALSQPSRMTLLVGNAGELYSDPATIQLQLPKMVSLTALDQTTNSWVIPSLAPGESQKITFLLNADDAFLGKTLSISASTPTQENEFLVENNRSSINLPVSASDAKTIILAAPERMAALYGPSSLMDELYTVAEHPTVDGIVVNLEQEQTLLNAYTAWDADPADWRLANTVAQEIKNQLDHHLSDHLQIENIVLVGGDSIVPHYRVSDNNPTAWQERNYAARLQSGTPLWAAYQANKLLIDDFYADRVPTVPENIHWSAGSKLYLPDFAIGRLVETPDDISQVIEAYLDADGVFRTSAPLVGGDLFLAQDLVAGQCALFEAQGLGTCSTNGVEFHDLLNKHPYDSTWTAFHSNHIAMGQFGEALRAEDVWRLPYQGQFMGTIGCHAGINEPDINNDLALDLMQANANQGGFSIASTAYTYGSTNGISYSEALFYDFTYRIITDPNHSVGVQLAASKQAYFDNDPMFENLDAKSIMPIILYGFPTGKLTPVQMSEADGT